ncbi:MAG: SDR family NAD(P)-dependent oxidoreductase, partial [Acidimicrobiales bacterium]|nr:SDR family NAD(P)-dependent oxidoreductase [Acidimicrobiales bacterium]
MDLGLSGRTALVTGASSGLGLATARALAVEGVRVALVSRSAEKLATAVATVNGDPLTVTADLSDGTSIDAMLTEVTEALGHVDILVANAGGPPPGGFASTDLETYSLA